ncbi:MAG: single-stranded DNA-binding protein, partial [Candidatus Methanomethylophilus sp.]|nr:single-stranded DNA-binding protein [Methanomethylophilus sp.]
MDNSDIIDWDPIVEELYSALEGKVEKKTLLEDLEKYVLKYRTGVAVAKDSIIKKYRNPRPAGTFFNGT